MSGRIPQHFIQDLVERSDIVALVGRADMGSLSQKIKKQLI